MNTLFSNLKKLNLFWLGTPVDIDVDVTKYFHQIGIFRFNYIIWPKKMFQNFLESPIS